LICLVYTFAHSADTFNHLYKKSNTIFVTL
jgi:hypothetical protein